MDPIYLISGGVMVSMLIAGVIGYNLLTQNRRQLEKRAMTVGQANATGGAAPVHHGIKRSGYGTGTGIERLISRFLPKQAEFRRRLSATGRPLTVVHYALGSVVTLIMSMVLMHVIGGMPLLSSILFGLTLCAGAPHFVVGRMITKRMNGFEAKFPDAIDLMVRGLRSGLPVSETIAAVGEEMQGPVGEEFRNISQAVKMGATLEDALWEAVERLDTSEFKFFVISLSVQQQTGGNLAETLANLSQILRQRRQMRLKIKAMSSEARASAVILGSLPFLMFMIIYLMNPDYESMLFTDERGKIMLGAACGIMGMGILVMRKMIRFEI